MHFVGFIIKKFVTMHIHTNVKKVAQLFYQCKVVFKSTGTPVTIVTRLRTGPLWNLGSIPSRFTSERTALGLSSPVSNETP